MFNSNFYIWDNDECDYSLEYWQHINCLLHKGDIVKIDDIEYVIIKTILNLDKSDVDTTYLEIFCKPYTNGNDE